MLFVADHVDLCSA